MATKLPRLTVTFPPELLERIAADARKAIRSESAQVIWVLTEYYGDLAARRVVDVHASRVQQTPEVRNERRQAG